MIFQFQNTYRESGLPVSQAGAASRITWVDHARGIAIILIVYRHVMVGLKRSGVAVTDVMYNMQEVFYNFRMPVFFVLSGVFVANSLRKRSRLLIVKERASTVLYPYLVWAAITISLQIIFSKYANSKRDWSQLLNIFVQPRGVDHLWYLFALFNTTMLYLLLSKFIRVPWVHLCLALAMHVVTFLPFLQGNSLLSDMLYFYSYFLLGTYLSVILLDRKKADMFLAVRNLWWLLPVFLVGQWFWFVHRDEQKTWYLLFFVINLIACYLVYILAHLISQRRGSDWLSYLGRYSLYIYILHVPVAAFIRNVMLRADAGINTWLLLCIGWAGGLLIPVLLYNALKPIGFGWLFSLKPRKEV